MDNKKFLKLFKILGIEVKKDLEENDLDYWHQKRYIEIQKSGQDKNTISKLLIELNNAKDNLDQYDLKTLKTKISTYREKNTKEQFKSKKREKENFIRRDINILFDQKFETIKESRGFEFKKIKKQWILTTIILFFIPISGLYYDLKYRSNLESEIDIKENNIKKSRSIDREIITSRGRNGITSQRESEFNQTSDKSIAYLNRGVAKGDIGDYSGAIDDYTIAIKLDPNYANAYYNRGVAKGEIGDYSGAIDDYTIAIKLDPNYANAYYNRGVNKNNKGDYSGAIDDYTNAIKLDPNYAFAYNNRGDSKQKIGDYVGAINDFTYAIKLDPKYTRAYNNRGYSKMQIGDYSGACKDIEIAIRLGDRLNEKWFSSNCKN